MLFHYVNRIILYVFLCVIVWFFFFFFRPKEEDSNSGPEGLISPTEAFYLAFRMFTKFFIYNQLQLDTTERLHFHFSLSCIGEGNGNPLQCSCLENPRDRGAWWAAVHGVAQSRTHWSDLAAATQLQNTQRGKQFQSSKKQDLHLPRQASIYIPFTLYLQLFT